MANGMNPMGMLDPSLPLMQQQAEQAQAYAAALRGQALTPIKTDDMVSGRVVRVSPLQPLAKMLQAYMGAQQQGEANLMTGHVAAAQGDAMRRMIDPNYQTPIPGVPSQAGPPAALAGPAPEQPSPASDALGAGAAGGSVGPTSDNAARMASMLRQAPAQLPMQPQPQAPQQGQGSGAMAMPSMTPQQAMSMMLMGGPEEYAKAFAARTDNRTDLVKALISAGIDPASEQGKTALVAGVNKLNYIAPTSLRPGGYVQNPNGSREQLPQVPEGSQATHGPDGQWQITPVQGGAEAISTMSGAKAAGTAPFQIVENFDPVTGAPGKQFAGTTPGLIIPSVPGAAPVRQPARAAQRPLTITPAMRAEAAASSASPSTLAGMDGLLGAGSAAPSLPGQSLGVQTGPALGQVATANELGAGTDKSAVQNYQEAHTQALAAPRAIGLLQSIEQLADKTLAGPGANKLQFVNGVLQTLGIPVGQDSAQNYQLMVKNLNMLVGAQRSAAGGGGTDSLQHLAESANPNVAHMNGPALKESAQELIAYQRMVIARDKVAPNPNTLTPQAYADFETKFAPLSDPRLWQIEHASDDKERTRILSLMPSSERGAFMKKAAQARQMGVLN